MKLWSTEHVFSYPWKQVTEAAWKKYPNEHNTNVVAIDVIDRKITPEGAIHTTRIFGSHWSIPKVITALFGMPKMCYAVEHSEVDLKNEKMTLKMINYTFWGILAVEEKLVYSPDKDNPHKTHLEQGAKICVNGISFSNYFEDVIAKNFESTSGGGRIALESVLQKLKIETILETVSTEIKQLSDDIDKATSGLKITERLTELTEDLDRTATLINNEFQHLSSEFKNLITSLHSDLSNLATQVHCAEDLSKKDIGLVNAVKQAGITTSS